MTPGRGAPNVDNWIARVVLDGSVQHTIEYVTASITREAVAIEIARGFIREARNDVTVELRLEGERYDGKRYRVRHALEIA